MPIIETIFSLYIFLYLYLIYIQIYLYKRKLKLLVALLCSFKNYVIHEKSYIVKKFNKCIHIDSNFKLSFTQNTKIMVKRSNQ